MSLHDKYIACQTLFLRATTNDEREAAKMAMDRIKERMNQNPNKNANSHAYTFSAAGKMSAEQMIRDIQEYFDHATWKRNRKEYFRQQYHKNLAEQRKQTDEQAKRESERRRKSKMPKLAPNKEYNCEISFAVATTAQNTGTPGVKMTFDDINGEGSIEHTIWITPKTLEYAERDFETIGVTKVELQDSDFWDIIGDKLVGKKARIVTHEEEYNGKPQVKVRYIRKYGAAAQSGSNLSAAMATLFGGKPKTPPVQVKENIPAEFNNDSDVPF